MTRPRVKRRNKHPEQRLQQHVAALLHAALDPARVWWTAIDHSTKDALHAKIKHGMGVKAGLPDIWIVWRARTVDNIIVHPHILCIELKSLRGVMSDAQDALSATLWNLGVPVYVCDTLDGVIAALKEHGVPMRAKVW